MVGRSLGVATLVVVVAGAAAAADVTVYGHLYGAVTDDLAEGSLGPTWSPNTPVGESVAEGIERDGDGTYNFRLEADVGVRAAFDERVTGNVLFTFDDRKQPRFYRYALLEPSAGDYYVSESAAERKYVYGSLEQVDVELPDVVAETDVTLGGFDIRYGHGGYYNALINRIDPTSFVAYLDPFGVRAARKVGPVAATLAVGAGVDGQAIVATSERMGGAAFFFAAEGRAYDLKSLWDTHYAAALPKYWRYYFTRELLLAEEPITAPASLAKTYHVGVEYTLTKPTFDLYAVAAYHAFGDDNTLAEDPTGGTLIQIYPDFGVQVLGPRLWLRGAVLYEIWKSNYHSAFGDEIDANDYFMVFAEPEYFLTEDLFVGVGGRFLNPAGRSEDDANTRVRENKSLSIALVPHVAYVPAEGVKIDVTYSDVTWDPSYDEPATDYSENRAHELKLEVEAAF